MHAHPKKFTMMAAQRALVAAGLVWLDPRTLLVQRRAPGGGHGAGCLELPGGKIERGESPAAALARELLEEWGPAASGLPIAGVVDVLHHVYPPPGPEILLCVYHVDGRSLRLGWDARLVVPPGVCALALSVDDLPLAQFLAADRPLMVGIAGGETVCPFAPHSRADS